MSSRWADTKEEVSRRKKEKEEKRRLKAQKLEVQNAQRIKAEQARAVEQNKARDRDEIDDRPSKRRRVSNPQATTEHDVLAEQVNRLSRFSASEWGPCRRIDNFVRLNHIEEGSYGWVSRAQEVATGDFVALKKLKMDDNHDGFPVTALREVQTLNEARHQHVVSLREVVVGSSFDEVYLVMDFIEHDLKTLQDDMAQPFLPSEVKTLMRQLISAVSFLHSHWIIHRDIKTSNILLNNNGEIKLADFGMARYTSDPPPPNLTQLVVTLWYRAPELLLGAETYGFEVDAWSIGCVFGELLQKEPVLCGKNEVDQIAKIFLLVGFPTRESYPGFTRLPNAKSLRLPTNLPPLAMKSSISSRFTGLTEAGIDLLDGLLCLDPEQRLSPDEALSHSYFREDPRPKATEMFPTFPSKAGMEKRRRRDTPSAPRRAADAKSKLDFGQVDLRGLFADDGRVQGGAGFQLKMT